MMDAKRIEEMKRLSAEATEGVSGKWDTDELFVIEGDGMNLGECVAKCETEADAQFIAESRQFVPDIIAAYEAQAEEIAELRKALEFYADEGSYIRGIDDGFGGTTYDECLTDFDGGNTAREALTWRNTTRK